jgi:hypothetical protein
MAKRTTLRFAPLLPRVVTKQQAAEYLGISEPGFDGWVKKGILPGPIPGTNRWDLRTIDRTLDEAAGATRGL